MKKITLFLPFVVWMASATFVSGAQAAAFGVAPPLIKNDHLKPGSQIEYTIDLNTNDPSQDMKVVADVTGDPEVVQWLTIRDKETLTMLAGQPHNPLYIDVSVPEDAPLGTYMGDISLTIMPKKAAGKDVSIFLGGHISVSLTVVDYDFADFQVKSVGVQPLVEGQPLRLNLSIQNFGNVPVSSIQTTVEVFDHKTNERVAEGSGGQLSSSVYPNTTRQVEMMVELPPLPTGNYQVAVSAFKDDQAVYQNKLYLAVESPDANNILRTSVDVGLKNAASNDGSQVTTSVKVKPPFGRQIMEKIRENAPVSYIVIGAALLLFGTIVFIAGKIFLSRKGN